MPEDNFKRLGNALRNARKSRGFTQDMLSDASGVSTRHIAKIEKGSINPSFDVLERLVKALGISFDSLFDPPSEQERAEIQELTSLYRACPSNAKRLILASVRAIANEIMDTEKE